MIEWTKPQRPDRMDQDLYAAIPDKITLRERRFNVADRPNQPATHFARRTDKAL